MPAPSPYFIGKALDGARVLWRHWFQRDTSAEEGHVREFSPTADFVRIAKTTKRIDIGHWYRCSDLRLVEVLQEKVPLEEPKRRRREEEDEE